MERQPFEKKTKRQWYQALTALEIPLDEVWTMKHVGTSFEDELLSRALFLYGWKQNVFHGTDPEMSGGGL